MCGRDALYRDLYCKCLGVPCLLTGGRGSKRYPKITQRFSAFLQRYARTREASTARSPQGSRISRTVRARTREGRCIAPVFFTQLQRTRERTLRTDRIAERIAQGVSFTEAMKLEACGSRPQVRLARKHPELCQVYAHAREGV